jgi:hypothetical protein
MTSVFSHASAAGRDIKEWGLSCCLSSQNGLLGSLMSEPTSSGQNHRADLSPRFKQVFRAAILRSVKSLVNLTPKARSSTQTGYAGVAGPLAARRSTQTWVQQQFPFVHARCALAGRFPFSRGGLTVGHMA